MKRQIPKHPVVPELNNEAVALITQLCFREDTETDADLLFVFGTCVSIDDAASTVSDLLGIPSIRSLVLTGGIPEYADTFLHGKPEAVLLYDALEDFIAPGVDILLETYSTHTLENVTEALKLKDFSHYKKILFVSKSFAAGRAYLTLKKYVPNSQLLQKTFDAHYPHDEQRISRDSWHQFEAGKQRVWGEFLRIREYGQRGDIAYDDVRPLVREIERAVTI